MVFFVFSQVAIAQNRLDAIFSLVTECYVYTDIFVAIQKRKAVDSSLSALFSFYMENWGYAELTKSVIFQQFTKTVIIHYPDKYRNIGVIV